MDATRGSPPVPNSHHMLVASITRIGVSRYGEDFSDFMGSGALQRSGASFFLDVFCYQRSSAR